MLPNMPIFRFQWEDRTPDNACEPAYPISLNEQPYADAATAKAEWRKAVDELIEDKQTSFWGLAFHWDVSKLFDVVKPHRAYFGMKDFQQIAVIKNMVRQLRYDIEIVPCPIVREADGLAMSSRNTLLSPECRANAPHIHKVLEQATRLTGEKTVEELKQWVVDEINKNPYLEAEYFEIVDDTELRTIRDWSENNVKVGCVAVHAGPIRLIDNIVF